MPKLIQITKIQEKANYSLLKIIALLAFISSASTAATLISPALPYLQKSMHLNTQYVTAIVSLFLIGYMLGQLIYGPIANKLGRVKALRVGMIINLVGIGISMITIHNQQITYLLIGRLISALGASAGLVCTIALINDIFSEQKAKQILSYAILSFTIGIYLGTYIGGLITFYFGWEYTLYALFIHGALLLYCTFFIINMENGLSPQQISIKNILEGYLTALKSKRLIAFSLILALATIISYLYATEAPLITQNKNSFNLNANQYGSWNIINAIGMVIGALLSVKLLNHYSAIKVLLSGIILTVLICTTILIFKHIHLVTPILFFSATSLLFLASSLVYPSAVFYASNSIPCKVNASAMTNFINMFVSAIFVTIISYIHINNFFKLFIGLLGYAIFSLLILGIFSKTTNSKN